MGNKIHIVFGQQGAGKSTYSKKLIIYQLMNGCGNCMGKT